MNREAGAEPDVQSAADRLQDMQRAYGCIPGIGNDLNRDVSELLAEHAELQREHAASAARVVELEEQLRWIPLSEGFPAPHTFVMVLHGRDEQSAPTGARWTGEVWLQSVGSFTLKRVTHWREIGPLPETALAQPDAARAEGEMP